MKFVCPVCGYVHEGDTPPEFCPVCKVPGSKFTKVEGEIKLAAEHQQYREKHPNQGFAKHDGFLQFA